MTLFGKDGKLIWRAPAGADPWVCDSADSPYGAQT